MIQLGHVVSGGDIRNKYIFSENLNAKHHLGAPDVDGRIILG
jgi:hypothetical protein